MSMIIVPIDEAALESLIHDTLQFNDRGVFTASERQSMAEHIAVDVARYLRRIGTQAPDRS